METEKDVVIIGGCGRARLPLGIARRNQRWELDSSLFVRR